MPPAHQRRDSGRRGNPRTLTVPGRHARWIRTRPAPARRDDNDMLTKVAYDERTYPNPVVCLGAIRERIQLGWNVVQLRGPDKGPFLVVFRKDGEQ